MVERRDTSLDKEVGLSPHNSVRLFLPVNLAGADRDKRRFAPGQPSNAMAVGAARFGDSIERRTRKWKS
jgi:hypothetical protein